VTDRPAPPDHPVRVRHRVTLRRPGKTYHFEVDGEPACDLGLIESKVATPKVIYAGDRPCPDCLAVVDPDRPAGRMPDHGQDQALETCPVCRRALLSTYVADHVRAHDPEEFGLSPLREDDAVTDGGASR
jgi:hypothetical protein